MEAAAVVYFCAGVLWGVFAVKMQCKFHPTSSAWKMILVLLLNAIFWPLAMMIAIFWPFTMMNASHNLINGKHDKYFTKN